MAHVLATFAQFERRLISQRTREALAVKKSQGVRLGRPATMPPDVVRRIKRERAKGKSLAAIADGLNRDGVPTARWYPATARVDAWRERPELPQLGREGLLVQAT